VFRKHVVPEMLCGVVFCDGGNVLINVLSNSVIISSKGMFCVIVDVYESKFYSGRN
jgi:hypothetical protein